MFCFVYFIVGGENQHISPLSEEKEQWQEIRSVKLPCCVEKGLCSLRNFHWRKQVSHAAELSPLLRLRPPSQLFAMDPITLPWEQDVALN